MSVIIENDLGVFTSAEAAERAQKWHQSGLRLLHKIPGVPDNEDDLVAWAQNVDRTTFLNQKLELQLKRSRKGIWALDLILQDDLERDIYQLRNLIKEHSKNEDGYLVPVLAYFLGAMDLSAQVGQTAQAETYWTLSQEIMNGQLISDLSRAPKIYDTAVSLLVDQKKFGSMILFVDGLNLNIDQHTVRLEEIDSNKKRFERILPIIRLPQEARFEEMVFRVSYSDLPSFEEVLWSLELNNAFLYKQKQKNPNAFPFLENELRFFEVINLGAMSGDYSWAAFQFINMAGQGNRVDHYQDVFLSPVQLKQYFKNQLMGLNAEKSLFPTKSLEEYIRVAKNFTLYVEENIKTPEYSRSELLINVIHTLFRYNARLHTINSQEKFAHLSDEDKQSLQSTKGTFLETDLKLDFERALNEFIVSYY